MLLQALVLASEACWSHCLLQWALWLLRGSCGSVGALVAIAPGGWLGGDGSLSGAAVIGRLRCNDQTPGPDLLAPRLDLTAGDLQQGGNGCLE